VTGHVEASGGTLSFHGKRYTVTRGNVDFVDPLKIEPVVDVQAETDIRDYRVILAVSGKGDKLRIDTRSDPPLPQIEVINLIAGGISREELAERGTNVTQEQLFKGSAASILSDIVQQRLGGSAIQRLGLGSVRIGPDPSILSSRNQTTIRVTITEQVSKDLTVTYSRELSADKQEIVQIEYFVNKNISIIASKDEFGEKGLDIKFRKRFK
jgi:translocation and assembly module TamB